jgi:RNA polymerase sigma-70 factor (ECF subfamily)
MASEDTTRSRIARAREGDRAAFDALAGEHRERLLAFVHKRLGIDLRARIEPEDVVQDALLRAYESIERFEWRGPDSLFNWLATIVEFRIRDLSRAARRRPQVALRADPAGDVLSPSKHLRREERFERLEQALDRLSDDHREVIYLARIENLSLDEIASRTNRTPGAVNQLLLRALEKLRESFGEDTESLHLPPRSLGSQGEGTDA